MEEGRGIILEEEVNDFRRPVYENEWMGGRETKHRWLC